MMAEPDLERRMRVELSLLADEIDVSAGDELLDRIEGRVRRRQLRRRVVVAGAVAAAVLLVVGGASLWEPVPRVQIEPAGPVETPSSTEPAVPTPIASATAGVETVEVDGDDARPAAVTSVTGAQYYLGSPEFDTDLRTDYETALAGDGATPALIGSSNWVPDSARLEFLWDSCHPLDLSAQTPMTCRRDAHFVGDRGRGSSSLGAGEPFHVLQGFPADGPDPLGEGFDVALYVTRSPDDLEDLETEYVPNQTVHFTADAIVSLPATRCGPQYREQSEPVECAWYLHDFPDGLPSGRYEVAVVWEAPCRAWVELGLGEACDDPEAVQSWFSSAVDSPWDDATSPSFVVDNHVGLTQDEVFELEHGIDADRYAQWMATVNGILEAFNAGRLDDYLSSFAANVTGPDDLLDPDMVASLMAASAAWSNRGCWPGDGGDLTCSTIISDQFHHESLRIEGDLSISFDADGRILAVEPDRSEQTRDPRVEPLLEARRSEGEAFRKWLEQTRPNAVGTTQDPWLANGMPTARDMPVVLPHVPDFLANPDVLTPTAITTVEASSSGRRLWFHAETCTAEHDVEIIEQDQAVIIELQIATNRIAIDCDDMDWEELHRPLGNRTVIDATTGNEVPTK